MNFSQVEQNPLSLIKLMEWNKKNEMEIKNVFMFVAESLLHKDFSVTEERGIIITELLKYFTGNKGKFSLDKGIYLYGTYGVGKSILLSVIQKTIANCFPFNPNGFMIKSLEDVIDVYKVEGNLDSITYRKESKPKHLCINEFGKKIDDKIYGTSADQIIHSLFMLRYQLFQEQRILTHATSNYTLTEIEVEPIVLDRMAEMFNFIEIKGNSFRK